MNGKSPILFPAEALELLSDEAFWSYVHELASLASTGTDTEAETHPEECLRCQLSHGDCLIPLVALYELVLPPQGAGKGHPYASLPATPAWMVGLFAWRGETIAVIDLDAYLSSSVCGPGSTAEPASESTLLIADCSGLAIGLLVSAVGSTISGLAVLDLPTILADVVQQIRDACPP